jgi:hypothetical protein
MFIEYDIITKVFNSTGQTGCINVKKTVTTQPRNLSHVLVDVLFFKWSGGGIGRRSTAYMGCK